ncbi:MAG: Aminodeoxychorismate synthase component 1 [Gammaproteobacteria bacterium]|nr:MAG: Aminodeoxychorismate synthase component 1 [Gammaproteobacteria bacterium]
MNKQKRITYDYYGDAYKIFSLIKDNDWSVLLCSHHEKFKDQKYDIISSNPIEKIYAYQGITFVESGLKSEKFHMDPIEVLNKRMMNYKSDYTDIPFSGGAIGYLSYDLGNEYEDIENKNIDEDLPLMAFGIYDWCILIDHENKKTILVYESESNLIKIIRNSLDQKSFDEYQKKPYELSSECKSNMSYDEYRENFNKIQSYIREGDCYQINYSQRFSLSYSGDTWDIFNKIAPSYSSPYSAYLHMPFIDIMCFSPERFLSYDGKIVETKPIKGTRPVSSDPKKNERAIKELSSSDKEKAENLMIVDLLRNDLGRNCEFGSVEVKKLFDIETFSNVHHLVSTIQGKISSDSSIFELIKGCFPGGSITGAPKIRAMQIINEIEPDNRSIYCGSIGYMSFNGSADLNIAIRTVIASKNKLFFWGGGGIVSDSEVESEYKETFDKIQPLLEILKS